MIKEVGAENWPCIMHSVLCPLFFTLNTNEQTRPNVATCTNPGGTVKTEAVNSQWDLNHLVEMVLVTYCAIVKEILSEP